MKILSAGNRKITTTNEKKGNQSDRPFPSFPFIFICIHTPVSVGQVIVGAIGLKKKRSLKNLAKKTLSIDLFVSIGGEKVSVIRLQLLTTWIPLRNATSQEKIRTVLPRRFMQVLPSTDAYLDPQRNVSVFKILIISTFAYSFYNSLHLHIFLMCKVIGLYVAIFMFSLIFIS